MSNSAFLLSRFKKRWHMALLLEMILYALGPAIFIYTLGISPLWSVLAGILVIGIFLLIKKPWRLTLYKISSYIDRELGTVAYSSSLLLDQPETLPTLARLQQHKVQNQLKKGLQSLKPGVSFFKAFLCAVFCIILSFLLRFSLWSPNAQHSTGKQSNPVVFTPTDSSATSSAPPKIISQQVTIYPPAYTGRPARSTSDMNLEVLEGSRLRWKLQLDKKADSIFLIWKNHAQTMNFKEDVYSQRKVPESSGFYSFKIKDLNAKTHVSDLYSIRLRPDEPPVVELKGLQPYTSFNYSDKKLLSFEVYLADDYGLGETFINATVTSGSGESVKFREQRIPFDSAITGKREYQKSKRIDLDSLQMQPGDELYFHVETRDLKDPSPNISRSETYFAKIEDTVSYSYAVEGSLGVDQMPAYFRSQRQLIIDTEKLIDKRSELSVNEYKSQSNALGAEQNALRMKYGKFMGEESEGGEEHDHHHDHEKENPIADYMHNHDGNNEHNLVEKDAQQAQKDTTGTGTTNSFERSLHSKMRVALAQMWDSELYLRTGKPQESLPYQHRALELLQDIKNAARIYVHRIGFEPPPIKEDKRLSGTIDDVNNYRKKENRVQPDEMIAIRKSVELLERILNKERSMSPDDRKVLEQAGGELAQKAMERPGNYLDTLRELKGIIESKRQPDSLNLRRLQSGFLKALDFSDYSPGKKENTLTTIQSLMLKEIDNYE